MQYMFTVVCEIQHYFKAVKWLLVRDDMHKEYTGGSCFDSERI